MSLIGVCILSQWCSSLISLIAVVAFDPDKPSLEVHQITSMTFTTITERYLVNIQKQMIFLTCWNYIKTTNKNTFDGIVRNCSLSYKSGFVRVHMHSALNSVSVVVLNSSDGSKNATVQFRRIFLLLRWESLDLSWHELRHTLFPN